MQSLWMIVASLLFACMGVCVKLGSAHLSTGELVFYRGLIGLLMMAVLLRVQGIPFATPHWKLQLSRGLSGTVALMCYFFALGILPLATAVTLNYTSPIFVALILAFAGGAYGFTRIRADFRARTRVERLVTMLLLAASLVAILTTFGIVFSLLFESVRFFLKNAKFVPLKNAVPKPNR